MFIHDDSILKNKIFGEFCDHLSSHLNVLNCIYTLQNLGNNEFAPLKDDPLILPIKNLSLAKLLKKANYIELVSLAISEIHILDSCADIFKSELDDDAFDLFDDALLKLTKNLKIRMINEGIIIHCPALLSDIIFTPLSRLHSEVIMTLEQFSEFLDAVNGDTSRLFLNAKGATPTSQFIQLWVSEFLGIQKTISNMKVVVT